MTLKFDFSPSYSDKTISRLDVIFNNTSPGYKANPIKELRESAKEKEQDFEDREYER